MMICCAICTWGIHCPLLTAILCRLDFMMPASLPSAASSSRVRDTVAASRHSAATLWPCKAMNLQRGFDGNRVPRRQR